jgi:hypothetical protein
MSDEQQQDDGFDALYEEMHQLFEKRQANMWLVFSVCAAYVEICLRGIMKSQKDIAFMGVAQVIERMTMLLDKEGADLDDVEEE